MKKLIFASCLGLLVAFPVFARPNFIVLEEGHKQHSPDKFGYKIERKDIGDKVHLAITMSPDAAKACKQLKLWVYSGDTLVLDANLATTDLEDGKKQLLLTVAKTHLDKSQIVIHSTGYNAPIVPNFAGFRVMLKDKKDIAEPKDALDKK